MEKRDYSVDRELFDKALTEVICKKFDEAMKLCDEDASYTKKHKRKMDRIFGFDIENPRRRVLTRNKLIALWVSIISAIVIFTACAFGNKIASFIEFVYETYIKVENDNSNEISAQTINEVYTLGYVPERFELVSKNIKSTIVSSLWSNSNGAYLNVYQILSNNKFYSEIRNEYRSILTYNEIEIYYRTSKDVYNYVWRREDYAFKLVSSEELELDELRKIIDGMKIE